MSDIVDQSLEPVSLTLTGIDQKVDVQALSDGLMPDVSFETVPTSDTARSGAFLVENWLVGQGEG
jgi:hypothetical protein